MLICQFEPRPPETLQLLLIPPQTGYHVDKPKEASLKVRIHVERMVSGVLTPCGAEMSLVV